MPYQSKVMLIEEDAVLNAKDAVYAKSLNHENRS